MNLKELNDYQIKHMRDCWKGVIMPCGACELREICDKVKRHRLEEECIQRGIWEDKDG